MTGHIFAALISDMKKTPQKRKRLPSGVSRAIKSIEFVQHGFDVLKGHIDSSDPTLPLDKLNAQSGGVFVKLGAKSHAPMLGTKIKVLQPSTECLFTLRDELPGAHRLVLNYIEVAADVIPPRGKSTRWLRNWVLGHLTIKYSTQRVHRPTGRRTFYYGRRANKAGQRRPRVGVLYADRETKLAGPHKGRRCVHIEMRLFGPETLASVGVFGVADLIDFDFGAFWRKVAQLRRIPNKSKLGALLGGRGTDVTDKALRKRAARLQTAHRIGSAFVLQNALLAEPVTKGALEDIDMDLIFRFGNDARTGDQ